ncbi:basic leucine zipper 34-like [Henckelia pumila]|uniref:basic leucine zipper 34-like n=1 Tax=Henckelia pumila TaxID=405737 RepID=UPI003C6DCF53
MAQLPPKVPSMTQNWPHFPPQNMSNDHNLSTNNILMTSNPSWNNMDEFLNFSSLRRGSHRRSASDSVAFLDPPMVEECRRASIAPNGSMMINGTTSGGGGGIGCEEEFERFDDEQFMSMFTDEVGPTMSSSSPSPSDHNSMDDHDHDHVQKLLGPSGHHVKPKSEPEEVQSSCKLSDEFEFDAVHITPDNSSEKIFDPKRIKRILANRQSAQRSRVRKLQYISELERSVTSLQAEVSVLSPRVAFLDHQRLVLNVDNSVLKQRIAALAQDKVFKDAHQEALKREIERLRQLYCEQNLKKMENSSMPLPKSPLRSAETNCAAENIEQLVN